jgi:hypothetical protein
MALMQAICEVVSKMSRLKTYIVMYSPSEISMGWLELVLGALPEFPAFSPQFCQNLQKLDLSLPIAKAMALNLHAVEFPCLDPFALNTRQSESFRRRIDPEVEKTESFLITVLAPFLRRCRVTLEHLLISTDVDLDRSPFLNLLGVFPKLISVALQFTLNRQDTSFDSPVTHFVNRHAETLRSLAFKPCTRTSFQRIRIIFSKIDLPHLQKLEVEKRNVSPAYIVILDWCIRPFVYALTTIYLTRQSLQCDELQILLDLFAQNPQILRTASLWLPSVSPRVVDLLANKLPGLQNLTISFYFIKGDVYTLPNNSRAEVHISRACTNHPDNALIWQHRFCREMEGRSYPNWRLRNISLVLRYVYGSQLEGYEGYVNSPHRASSEAIYPSNPAEFNSCGKSCALSRVLMAKEICLHQMTPTFTTLGWTNVILHIIDLIWVHGKISIYMPECLMGSVSPEIFTLVTMSIPLDEQNAFHLCHGRHANERVR